GHSIRLHTLARRRDGRLGMDVRRRPGRHRALRRAAFSGRPVRAGRGGAR
ncbi:MAG: Permease of the drug/metabolite transporter (DMT) superfamily, partial [uncultured Rubrobacteraceae bacterium]